MNEKDFFPGSTQKNKITPNGQALGHMMMWAELDGVVCSGPCKGKQFTYMLLEERTPSHGPATIKDIA